MCTTLGCVLESHSSFGGGNSEPAYEWDVSELESARGDLLPATAPRCAIALRCAVRVPDEPKVACALAIAEATADGERVPYDGYAAVERRGRSSLFYPKANYALELRDEDGTTDRPINLLGMGKDEDWVLDGSWVDRSFVRNQIVSELFSSAAPERYAPEARYCVLNLNEKYQGIYRLVERPKRDGQRIDIAKDDGSGQSFIIRQDDEGRLHFPLGFESQWKPTYPNANRITDSQLRGIQEWLDQLHAALKKRTPGTKGVFGFLDREDVIDWILIQELSKNIDAYKLSVHLYKDRGDLARLVPWDFDMAFGQPKVNVDLLAGADWDLGGEELANAHRPKGWIAQRSTFLKHLLAVPDFPEALTQRWFELRASAWSTDEIMQRLERATAAVEPEARANFERWPLKNVDFQSIYPPYSLYRVETYEEEVERLRDWIGKRLEWMDEHIEAFAE